MKKKSGCLVVSAVLVGIVGTFLLAQYGGEQVLVKTERCLAENLGSKGEVIALENDPDSKLAGCGMSRATASGIYKSPSFTRYGIFSWQEFSLSAMVSGQDSSYEVMWSKDMKFVWRLF